MPGQRTEKWIKIYEDEVVLRFEGPPTPRKSWRMMYNHKTGRVQKFDPQASWLKTLKTHAIVQLSELSHARGRWELWGKDSEVIVKIEAYFKIPQRWKKDKYSAAQVGKVSHIIKPDCDNLAKLYLDIVKGVVFYDDSQVSTLIIKKQYAKEEPYTIVKCLKMPSKDKILQ